MPPEKIQEIRQFSQWIMEARLTGRSAKPEETDISSPKKDCLFSPVKDAKQSVEMKTPDQKTEKPVTSTPVSGGGMNSMIPQSTPTSQLSLASPLFGMSSPDESTDMNKLSAGARRRYKKNMEIISQDSLIDDNDPGSVAHVSYYGEKEEEENKGMSFEPDEDYYKNVTGFDELPTEKKEEEKEPLEYHTMSSIVQPTMAEMMQGETLQSTDAIPCLDDSLIV